MTFYRFALSAYSNPLASIAPASNSVRDYCQVRNHADWRSALPAGILKPPSAWRLASEPTAIIISWDPERLGAARHHRDHDDDTSAVFDDNMPMLRSLCLSLSLLKRHATRRDRRTWSRPCIKRTRGQVQGYTSAFHMPPGTAKPLLRCGHIPDRMRRYPPVTSMAAITQRENRW